MLFFPFCAETWVLLAGELFDKCVIYEGSIFHISAARGRYLALCIHLWICYHVKWI